MWILRTASKCRTPPQQKSYLHIPNRVICMSLQHNATHCRKLEWIESRRNINKWDIRMPQSSFEHPPSPHLTHANIRARTRIKAHTHAHTHARTHKHTHMYNNHECTRTHTYLCSLMSFSVPTPQANVGPLHP